MNYGTLSFNIEKLLKEKGISKNQICKDWSLLVAALQSSLFYASIRFKDINKKWQHCFLFPNI